MRGPGVDLVIRDAVIRPHASGGDAELDMTVRNASGVPEHLGAVMVTSGGAGTLSGGKRANGSLSSAGILIEPGSAVVFGGHGDPAVLLPVPGHRVADAPVPVIFQFGVAGLVRLRVPVAANR